jgi:hypothetical protein
MSPHTDILLLFSLERFHAAQFVVYWMMRCSQARHHWVFEVGYFAIDITWSSKLLTSSFFTLLGAKHTFKSNLGVEKRPVCWFVESAWILDIFFNT